METSETAEKKPDYRMNYWHQCECGMWFEGYIHQHTCWSCIKGFLLSLPNLGCRR
jgi:hypothetical protein